MVSVCRFMSLNIFSKVDKGLKCFFGGKSLMFWMMLWMGFVAGRVRSQITVLWQFLFRASSIGRMFACVSRESLGDILSVLVIANVAILCIFCRFLRIVIEPDCLVLPSSLLGGKYQAARPYMIFGDATAM